MEIFIVLNNTKCLMCMGLQLIHIIFFAHYQLYSFLKTLSSDLIIHCFYNCFSPGLQDACNKLFTFSKFLF